MAFDFSDPLVVAKITEWDTLHEENRYLGACLEYLGPIGRNPIRLNQLLDCGVDETWFLDSHNRDFFIGLFEVSVSIGSAGSIVRAQGVIDVAEARTTERGWARPLIQEYQNATGYLDFAVLLSEEIPIWWQKLKRSKLISLLGKLDQTLTLPPSKNNFSHIDVLIEQVSAEWKADPAIKPPAINLFDAMRKRCLEPLPLDSHYPTGLTNFDEILGGGFAGATAPDAGRLIIVAARPGSGKTLVAVNLAMRIAARGSIVAMWSLEMQPEQIALRTIAAWDYVQQRTGLNTGKPVFSSAGKITYNNLRQHDLAPAPRQRLAEENYTALDANFKVYNGDSGLTAENICRQMRLFVKQFPDTRLLVIDHLGLLDHNSKSANQAISVGEATRLIKTTAVNLGVDVLLLCQLNRGLEARTDKMPLLSDLRDSGRIEEDADLVLGLYRPAYYSKEPSDADKLQIGVLKNRQGELSTQTFLVDLNCCALANSPFSSCTAAS